MLKNPIHLRLEKLTSWQLIAFTAALCERMYPNFALYCDETNFCEAQKYKDILDTVWEIITVKNARINFERQLEKLEPLIPEDSDDAIYLTYPAIDATISLSALLHAQLDSDTLVEQAIKVSQLSAKTIVQLELAQNGTDITQDNYKEYPVIVDEFDIQWNIIRYLKSVESYDQQLIRSLRQELRTDVVSNIGITLS